MFPRQLNTNIFPVLCSEDDLELLAPSFGCSTWAEELLAETQDRPIPVATAPDAPVSAAAARYPLRNADGRFSFVRRGRVLTGRLHEVTGTCDDIPDCIAKATLGMTGGSYQGKTVGTSQDWRTAVATRSLSVVPGEGAKGHQSRIASRVLSGS